ncbi:storkhead-box protein 1 isoform X2 [Pogoniulus pusillus]|uniref:storkhead-box protein 1 isoform X2 n=1 Tax=Pogoniulus pusillus TaxID=488313 RepID=UPI0030B9466B
MNPLSQSHSVPLAEGICRTILDMNANHVVVTQEALMEQLDKNYPGITLPSHKTLHKILGTLIKERKIYHTGEGYFIVTPSTYFIPSDTIEDKREVPPLEKSCCCSSPSIIYLVNFECCADLMKENVSAVSHYRSCYCFPDQNMLGVKQWHLMNHEPNGRGRKGCNELKPSIQTQGIATSAEKHSWDTIRSLTSVKEKLKSKRFGLGLFWRSASKKEKMKKVYSTFSAQFPPKEWPVRDEEDLDNIPRDIEHEIIKHINPTLTIDNLIKHTILMQKFEEQKKYTSDGTLAEASIRRQKHPSEDYSPKMESKPSKHTCKNKSKKEKHISRSNRKPHIHELTSESAKLEENPSLPIRNQEPSNIAVESHVIYKKQIKNPFQGLSRRHSFHAKGYKSIANKQIKSRTRKQERAFQKPQSLNSPKIFDYKNEELAMEKQTYIAKHNVLLHPSRSSLQLRIDSLRGNFNYPQGSILQTDNKSKCFLESNISEENIYRRKVQNDPEDAIKSPCSYAEDESVCKEDAQVSLHSKDECCRSKADAVCELVDQTAKEFKNVCLSNYTAKVNMVRKKGKKYRQKTDEKSELVFKYDCASHPRSVKLESEGFTDNCHLLYQKAQDGNICNSLHLDDNFELCHLPPGHALSTTRDSSAAVQRLYLKNCKVNTYPAQHNTTVSKDVSGEHVCKESVSFAESINGSKEHPNTDFPERSRLCSQVLPTGHRKELETGLNNCMMAPAAADFCPANEADSDADALQNFAYEMGTVVACCVLGSQAEQARNLLGKDLFVKDACTVTPGQKHPEGMENHSITGDSGIDSPSISDELTRSFLTNSESIKRTKQKENCNEIPCFS